MVVKAARTKAVTSENDLITGIVSHGQKRVTAEVNRRASLGRSDVRKAMTELANKLRPDQLAQKGVGLYEQLRPKIPEGVQGWGAKGGLDLGRISKRAAQTH